MHLMLTELANNQPVLQVEMRHFHPQLKAAQEWMEKNTAKVKKVILPGIGRTSKEDKKAFSDTVGTLCQSLDIDDLSVSMNRLCSIVDQRKLA